MESPRLGPGKGKRFSLLQNFQTGFGSHTASYSKGTTILPRRYSGRGVMLTIDLHSYSAEVKNRWSYTSTPPIFLRDVDRGNVTFLLYGAMECLS